MDGAGNAGKGGVRLVGAFADDRAYRVAVADGGGPCRTGHRGKGEAQGQAEKGGAFHVLMPSRIRRNHSAGGVTYRTVVAGAVATVSEVEGMKVASR